MHGVPTSIYLVCKKSLWNLQDEGRDKRRNHCCKIQQFAIGKIFRLVRFEITLQMTDTNSGHLQQQRPI